MSDIVLVNLEGRRPNKPSEEKNLIPKTCTVTTPEEFEPARRNPNMYIQQSGTVAVSTWL